MHVKQSDTHPNGFFLLVSMCKNDTQRGHMPIFKSVGSSNSAGNAGGGGAFVA